MIAEISPREIQILEEYRDQIESALRHVSEHLHEYSVSEFSADELQELNDIRHEARDRFHVIETIIGKRLIHDAEQSLQALHQIYGKIQTVQGTISGVFIVDSEIMFMSSKDLLKGVENIFEALENPFVVEHIDETILLAARNLLDSSCFVLLILWPRTNLPCLRKEPE